MSRKTYGLVKIIKSEHSEISEKALMRLKERHLMRIQANKKTDGKKSEKESHVFCFVFKIKLHFERDVPTKHAH